MNVLFITHYSSLYGANRSLLALLDGFENEEITPFILLPSSGDIEGELQKRGIGYFIFPFKKWMAKSRFKMPLRILMNILAIPFLLWKIKDWNIDLVYTNSSVTPIGAWIAFGAGLPHIWHIREFGWEDYRLKYDLGRNQFEYWLDKANHLIPVSKSLQEKVLENVSTSSTVIYNGVISKKRAERMNIKFSVDPADKKIFGIIGLLSPAKGQEQAIKAFSKIYQNNVEIELWIAGSGSKEYEEYLSNLANDLGVLQNVKFLGYVDDPFEFFSEINIALVCSPNEGMGRVTAEAMIAGKVIIGLDNAGTSELINEGETGLLYDGSVSSLAKKMRFALKGDLTDLAINAREKGLENFLIQDYAKKVESILNNVLKTFQ